MSAPDATQSPSSGASSSGTSPPSSDAKDGQLETSDKAPLAAHSDAQPAREADAPTTRPAQEYLTKKIQWVDFKTGKKKEVLIITQNENGPCPLVAICNVLFLRGDLEIRPPDREEVSFEYLVERLGDYLLSHGPASNDKGDEEEAPKMERTVSRQSTAEYVLTYRYNLDAALSILPNLQTGLDVNIRFSSIRGFEPTAELAMFDLYDVDLVHGWLADPQDQETYRIVVDKCGSYNSVVECVVQGDTLSSGAVVDGGQQQQQNSSDDAGSKQWTPEQEQQIQEGLVAAAFLEDTATQLTYYGLESLATSIPKSKLCVLFRNNHFSTLFKHPETSTLYILVTDSGLASEGSVVWESLGDVDQGSSEFFDSAFQKPKVTEPPIIPNDTTDLDYVLALSLQQHEISSADDQRRRQQLRQQQMQQQQQQQQQQSDDLAKKKKRQSCVIS